MGLSHLISMVGAGPGDPELLTVKALKRLKEADVVLYDGLMGNEILDLANPAAVKKYVGKMNNDGQDQGVRQEEIHSEFLFWAGKNKKVVRLKAGDPMIYGRGAEEIRFCKTNNLNYEVIPGITAGIAGASLFSVPLTERGKNNMLLFYTGRNETDGFPQLDTIVGIIKTGSPVVVYMGLNHLPELAKQLLNNGSEPSVPVRIWSKISQNNQRSYSTTLGEVNLFLEKNSPATPSVVVIGKNIAEI